MRPHPGQLATSRNLMRLLDGSEILPAHRDPASDKKVQDAYSLRCAPQVHGAAKDALGFVRGVLEVEVNAATDNPLVFPEEDRVISGGNFHGQPISQAMDFASIAMTHTAGISERRVEYMLDPATSDHLPAFLTRHGGLHSGLMIAQVTAAALVSENKTLAHPASVDSIPTSANKEDYVSMGAYAARKLDDVCQNSLVVVAVELLCAAQALEFIPGLRPGRGVEAALGAIRAHVPPLEGDRPQTPDIEMVARLVLDGSILAGSRRRGRSVGDGAPVNEGPATLFATRPGGPPRRPVGDLRRRFGGRPDAGPGRGGRRGGRRLGGTHRLGGTGRRAGARGGSGSGRLQ